MLQPTYTYEELLKHIQYCDEVTLVVIVELLQEEGSFYFRDELITFYLHIRIAIETLKIITIVKFKF